MKDDSQAGAGFNYYQNANADADAIRAGFLVRQYEYSVILGDLVQNEEGSVQHYLLLGRRGSGKSTLLRRLQVEIDTNNDLNNKYIAVNLAEEQANIYRFYDLLEEIARELEFRQVEINWPDDSNIDLYTQRLLETIHDSLLGTGKRLVLLLDNIDRVFESLGEEATLLRAYLQNFGDIKIIGGSTRMTEHFWSYDNPFYDFFRVLRLEPLDSEEMKKLLLDWADRYKAPALRDFVEKRPGQLETVRILTDGLPRTLQFFVNILLTHDQGTGYDYLRLLMDKVTPLYQERLIHLPPSQRKIVLQLAFYWEAVGAKDLAAATRMENKVVSAQLAQLIDKGVAEKVSTGTKNHLYRLSERFFNLWLIFTQGSPSEKRRARYLSIFLENFYDAEEEMIFSESKMNAKKVREMIQAIEQGDIEKAEHYYTISFEKEIRGSAFELANFYYKRNINKERALYIVKRGIERGEKDSDILNLMIVLKVWNGDFAKLSEELRELIAAGSARLPMLVINLLAHHQVELVNEVFMSDEAIVDKIRPLYYVTESLLPRANLSQLKIPPELDETVNRLRDQVIGMRHYFYGNKS